MHAEFNLIHQIHQIHQIPQFQFTWRNTLELPYHRICTVKANPNHLHSPMRADDIKNALNEDEHVLTHVTLIH